MSLLSHSDGKVPNSAPSLLSSPKLYTGCSGHPTTHQASLSLPPWLSAQELLLVVGSSFLPPSSSFPSVLTWLQPSSCSLWGKAASLLFLPPSFRPCLCQVPPLSQASEQPWRQEGHVKSFFTVSRRHEGGGVRIVVGGLAPSHHCFNPSNTGGSFSPFLSTLVPLPTPLF